MQREVKFRGRRMEGGAWCYGNLNIEFNGSFCIAWWESMLVDAKANRYDPCHMMYDVLPKTVGQYTGYNDDNKQPIYEGDILSCYEYSYEVVFDSGSYVLYHTENKDYDGSPMRWGLLSRLFELSITKEMGIEVIGSIHDNAEYIK